MEQLTDAELARIAYGRTSDERGRDVADDAARELARRQRIAHDAATDAPHATVVHDQHGGPGDRNGPDGPDGPDDPSDDDALDDGDDGVSRRSRRRRAVAMLLASVVALGAVGVTAQLLAPRPSLEVFDRATDDAERAIESRLETFDPNARVRVVGVDGESTFFATLSSTAGRNLLCIGIAEFGAITIVECVPVEQFAEEGVANAIPLSIETGGLRIGDGFRYSWGPTGAFEVERLEATE